VAPLDLEAGGTWIGLNAAGVFAAITNRAGGAPDRSRRSRGELVRQALALSEAAAASTAFVGLRAEDYNGFHLLVGDRRSLVCLVGTGAGVRTMALEPGVHVVTERSFDAAPTTRPALARSLLASGAITLDALRGVLAHHAEPAFEGLCVHLDGMGYGTRSSTILQLGAADSAVELLHAEGPPCTHPHRAVAMGW
jgi:uncharacterized protein with NRDE domain